MAQALKRRRRYGALELEVWGGATASYLKTFRRRWFAELGEAGAYMAAILDYLDMQGVRGAHPMTVVDENDQDVTQDCWAAYQQRRHEENWGPLS